MEVICVNDTFSSEVLEFYAIHGVKTPIKNQIYNIRDVIKHITGDVGILLQEIINPLVPINTDLGLIHREVTWNINRFRTLSKEEITKEMINEFHKKTIEVNQFNSN